MALLVLFDIGNVVVLADQTITYDLLHQKHGVPIPDARQFFKIHAYDEFSRGSIIPKQFCEALRHQAGCAAMKDKQLQEAHDKHLYGVDNEIMDIVNKVKKKHDIGFFTDTNVWQTRRVEEDLIQLRDFSDVILRSHELHALKTDARCYAGIARLLKLPPAKIVLVDNSREKIEMARRCGLVGVWYQEHETMRYELLRQDLSQLLLF